MPRESASATVSSARQRLDLTGICLVASLGGLLFGFDTAVISGTENIVKAQYQLDALAEGLFTASALIGCLAGAAVAGAVRRPLRAKAGLDRFRRAFLPLRHRLRRRAGILASFQLADRSGRRRGHGLGAGADVHFRICPQQMRGRLVATFQLSIVIGILAAFLSNWLLARISTNYAAAGAGHPLGPEWVGGGWLHWIVVDEVWRGMLGVGVVPSAAFLVLLLFVPESPRWLASMAEPARPARSSPALAAATRRGRWPRSKPRSSPRKARWRKCSSPDSGWLLWSP